MSFQHLKLSVFQFEPTLTEKYFLDSPAGSSRVPRLTRSIDLTKCQPNACGALPPPCAFIRTDNETHSLFVKKTVDKKSLSKFFIYFYCRLLLFIHPGRHKNFYSRKRSYPLFFTGHDNRNSPTGTKHKCFFAMPESANGRIFFSLCKTFRTGNDS